MKTGNFILNWVPFFVLQSFYIYLEDYPFQNFSELGISDWENLRSPVRATLKNSKISLWIGKNLEVHSLRLTIENPNFESMDELGKVSF